MSTTRNVTAELVAVSSTSITIKWTVDDLVTGFSYLLNGVTYYKSVSLGSINGPRVVFTTIDALLPDTAYTFVMTAVYYNGVTYELDTTKTTIAFSTVDTVGLAYSVNPIAISADTTIIEWQTNKVPASLEYVLNVEAGHNPIPGEGIAVVLGSNQTSGTFYVYNTEAGDVITCIFTIGSNTIVANAVVPVYHEDALVSNQTNDVANRVYPALDIDMNNIIFPYINYDPIERPGGVITALEWNTILRLLLHQGNYTSKVLNNLDMNKLRSNVYAAMLKVTPLFPEDTSADNLQAKLELIVEQMQAMTQGIVPDASIDTDKLVNGAITIDKMDSIYEATLAKKNSELQRGLNAEQVGGATLGQITALIDQNLITMQNYTITDSEVTHNNLTKSSIITLIPPTSKLVMFIIRPISGVDDENNTLIVGGTKSFLIDIKNKLVLMSSESALAQTYYSIATQKTIDIFNGTSLSFLINSDNQIIITFSAINGLDPTFIIKTRLIEIFGK